MSDEFERAVQIGLDVLSKNGVEINPQMMDFVKGMASKFVELIDSHAKKKAEAAGDAAAAAVTTEDMAEALQRKKS